MASSSSLGIRCGGSILKSSIESSSSSSCTCLHFQNHHNLKFNQQKQKRITLQGCSILNNHHHSNRRGSVVSNCSASTTTAYLDTVFGTEMKKNQQIQENAAAEVVREIKVGVYGDEEEDEKKVPSAPISADKLDEWMTFSVPEIVKNIGEAPLLVHIYSSISKGVGGISSIGSNSASTATAAAQPVLEKTKADAESWYGVTKRWEEGSPVPDGIILVEQLKAEENGGGQEDENDEVIASDMSSSSTKTWGWLSKEEELNLHHPVIF